MRITVLGKSPAWQDAGGACSGYLVDNAFDIAEDAPAEELAVGPLRLTFHAVPHHLTPAEAGEHGSRAKVGRLVMTHFSDEMDALWARREAERAFDGRVSVAREGAVHDV